MADELDLDLVVRALVYGFGEVNQNLRQMTGETKETGKRLEEAAEKGDKFKMALTEINQGLELGKKALGAFKAGLDFAREGAGVERLRDSFESLGKTQEDLRILQKASLNTVSDYNLMLSTNRAKLLGVSTSTEDLAGLLEVAAVRGRAMGLTTTQAFNDIVTGVGRASPMILDNLGIVTGGAKLYDNYAKSIGKTVDQLTDAERKAALFNKVMEESKSMGPLIEDNLTQVERFDAAVENLGNTAKETFAGVVIPVLEGVTTGLTVVTKGSEELADSFVTHQEDMRKQLMAGTVTLEEYNAEIGRTAGLTGNATWETDEAGNSVLKFSDKVKFLSKEEVFLDQTLESSKNEMREMQDAMGDLYPVQQDLGLSVEQVAAKFDILKQAIGGDLRKENEDFMEKQGDLRGQLADVEAELAKLEGAHGKVAGSQTKNAMSADELIVANDKLAKLNAKLTEATDPAKQAEMRVQIDKLTAKIAGANQTTTSYIDNSEKIADLKGKWEEISAAVTESEAVHREKIASIIFNLALQRAAVDGVSEAELTVLTDLGKGLGLFDEQTATAIESVNATFATLDADGDIDAARDRVQGLIDVLLAIPTNVKILLDASLSSAAREAMERMDAFAGERNPYNQAPVTPLGGPRGESEFQHGGRIVVPPGYPNDRYMIRASSGEEVTVRTRQQQAAGAGRSGDTYNVTINDARAMHLWLDEQRRRKGSRIEANL